MKPLIVPLTHLSAALMTTLRSALSGAVVYRPRQNMLPPVMQAAEEEGFLEVVVPVSGAETGLAELTDAYERWMSLHRGADFQALINVAEPIPFFEESSVARIVGDLRAQGASVPDHDASSDRVTRALMFLTLAQACDDHNEALQQDLDRISHMEDALYVHMHGSPAAPEKISPHPLDDPCADKTDQRLRAWAQLARYDDCPRPVLVTPSPSVTASILEYSPVPDDTAVFDRPGIPPGGADACGLAQQRFTDAIAAVATGQNAARLADQPISEHPPVRCRMFHWKHLSLPALCDALLERRRPDPDKEGGSGLVLVELTDSEAASP